MLFLFRFLGTPTQIGGIYWENLVMEIIRGAVASYLVGLSSDRAVRVRALAGDIVLCTVGQDTLLSQCLSLPRCTNG